MKAGWQEKRLFELCETFVDGDWIESKDQSSEGVRLIQTGNIGNGIFKDRAEKSRYISNNTFSRLKCTEIFKGDCLISRLPDPVGRSCILPDSENRMITAVDCTIVRFKRKQITPEFFNYFSQSSWYVNAVESETTGTTRKRISRTKLGQINIPVPPLPEQRRIVAILDEAFAGIAAAKENVEQNLKNAKEVFENHLQFIFTRCSKDWKKTTLEKVLDIQPQNGWSPPSENHADCGTPVLTLSSVTGFIFKPDKIKFTSADTNLSKRYWVKNGDFLMTRSNTPEPVGHVAIAHGIEKPTIYPDLIMRMIPNQEYMVNEFLYYQMRSPVLRDEITERAQGANPTMKKISNKSAKTIPIFAPSVKIQKKIVEEVKSLSAETSLLESIYQQKLSNLEELKKSLLQQAFSGAL